MARQPLFPRHLAGRLKEALKDTPVVVLTGARQTGKSTLVKSLIGQDFPATYVTFDNLATRAAARSDPAGFIAGTTAFQQDAVQQDAFQVEPHPLVVDEVQYVPDLFPAIKEAVDASRRPGSFVLTGSANVLLLPKISESLAGRSEYLTLWPLSQGELGRRQEHFVDALFAARLPSVRERDDLRRELLRRALRGGFPEAIRRPAASRRRAWFSSYVDALIERDVRDLANIEGLAEIPNLLRLIAARSPSILNVAELSRSAGLNLKTLSRYLTLLERLYLVLRVPAWSGGLGARVTRHPKVLLLDTGLLAHLQGVDLRRYEHDAALVGSLVETFVIAELTKQLNWAETPASLFHFRDRAGAEVDVVLERRDGFIAGVEVKTRASVNEDDFRGLRALAARTRRKFQRGIVLYTGNRVIAFGANLHAVPVSALWRF